MIEISFLLRLIGRTLGFGPRDVGSSPAGEALY